MKNEAWFVINVFTTAALVYRRIWPAAVITAFGAFHALQRSK